jgi:uncharacterized protein with HEPN domain
MRRDDALLLDMVLACRKLMRFTQGLTLDNSRQSELVQSAVMREFQVIGDAARLITDATKSAQPHILWRVIAGMRNRLAHVYFDIRLDAVWDTIQSDIPPLITALASLVSAE